MAKWPSKKLKYVDIDLYKQRVWLTDSREVWEECCNFFDAPPDNTACDGVYSWWQDNDGKIHRMIGIFNPEAKVLVHECGHDVMSICDDLGILIGGDQQEPFCYMLEYLFEQASIKLKLAGVNGQSNGD